MKNIIYIDLDSTLNDLDSKWFDWVNAHFETADISSENVTHWNYVSDVYGENACDYWKNPEIYSDDIVVPREGAVDFVNYLKEKYIVVVITSSWPGLEKVKSDYIQRHFGVYNIIHSSDKYKHTSNGLLIDDRPKTVFDHCEANGHPGFIFDDKNKYGWSKLTEKNLGGHNQYSRNNLLCFETSSYEEIKTILKHIGY